jgi:hypothetical protein
MTYHAVAFCTTGLVLMFGQPQSRITSRTQGSGENSKRAVPAREVTNYRSRDQNGSFQQQASRLDWLEPGPLFEVYA